jgi:hypothetical protein
MRVFKSSLAPPPLIGRGPQCPRARHGGGPLTRTNPSLRRFLVLGSSGAGASAQQAYDQCCAEAYFARSISYHAFGSHVADGQKGTVKK